MTGAVLEHLRKSGLRLSASPDGRLLVEPARLLSDDLRELIRAHRAELLELVTGDPRQPEPQRPCRDCAHRQQHGNCGEPVAAGLADWFCIRWAPLLHAATCPAFIPRAAP